MKRNRDLWIIALLTIVITLSLTLGLWAASADEEIKLEKKDFPFLKQDITVTIIRDETKIEILSPVNMTFSDTSIPLKFTFEEKPILVGYQLDDEATKWFMIKDNQIGPVLKIRSLVQWSPFLLDEQSAARFYIESQKGYSIFFDFRDMANESGILETRFVIIENGLVTKIINRSSTTSPPLKNGIDLELFEEYVILPLRFDFPNVLIKLASAKKSEFTDLINENVFEFTIENLTPGEHELTVFVIDKGGVETSAKTIFSVVEPDLIVLANSIDFANAFDLMDYMNDSGIKPLRVTADRFDDFKNYSSILVLGGPDAPEGVGEIVQDVLTFEEQDSIRERRSKKMYVKEDVWSEVQLVTVLAGSDRRLTQEAHVEKRSSVVYRLKTQFLDPLGRKWVEIEPIQCGLNPWEQAGMPPGDYYEKEGVRIHDTKIIPFPPEVMVCLACSCPRGDTLYFEVSNPDVQKMLDFGYKISNSPPT